MALTGDETRAAGSAGHDAWTTELSRRDFIKLSGIAAFLAACSATLTPSTGTPSPGLVTPSALPPGGVPLAFLGGTILTMEAPQARASGLAVDGGRIVAVGSAEEIGRLIGASTRVVDLGGRTLLPAFVDAHAHYFSHAIYDTGDPGAYLDLALANGVATIGEAGVPEDHLPLIRDFAASGRLKPRTNLYLQVDDPCGESLGGWWKDVPPTAELGARFRIAGVKVWTDGGSCNRPARSYPYPDGSNGDLYFTPETLAPILADADRLGHQLVLHALGDRAIGLVKAALAGLLAGRSNEPRHRIDHNAILPPELLGGYDESGGIAVVFGSFPTCTYLGIDPRFQFAPTPEKVVLEWAWRGLIDANPGLHLGWHSDYPVFGPESVLHLYGFVTRKQVWTDGSICEPSPEMAGGAITVEEALHAMTIGAAYALNRDGEVGSLVPGKQADLVILSEDPTTIPPDALKDLRVLATLIGGEAAYCQDPFTDLCAAPLPTPTVVVATPSAAGSPTGANLAAGRSATASRSTGDHPAALAVDGDPATSWVSGAFPPQWLAVDLGGAREVGRLRLTVDQSPAGPTRHRILGSLAGGSSPLLAEVAQDTASGDVLDIALVQPATVDAIRIETVESPSWVAWAEVEVYGR